MKLISPDYHGKCPFCGSLVPETFQHLLISCSAWADIRLEVFASNFGRVFELDEASASVMLLGGEIRGENGLIVEGFIQGITLVTIDFLQSISTQRLRVLQDLRLAWPPRVNAREGTTVLQQGTELAGPGGSEPQGVLVGTNPTYPDLDSDLLRSVHSRNL